MVYFFPLFLIVFFLIALVLLSPLSFNLLRIYEVEGSKKEITLPLDEEEEFTIVYTHSVDLLPVYEVYYLHQGAIHLKETHFYNFGAGMGLLEGRGKYKEENGLLKIVDINEKIGSFTMKIGPVARQRLIYRNREIPLITYFEPHIPIKVEIESLNIWQYAWYRISRSF